MSGWCCEAGRRVLTLLLIATLIVACDSRQNKPDAKIEREVVPVREVPPAPPQSEESGPGQSGGDVARPGPLDLSLPADTWSVEGGAVDHAPNGRAVLPNLFDTPEKKRKTRVNAELFRDENNPDVIDSIEGMNVTIERELGD